MKASYLFKNLYYRTKRIFVKDAPNLSSLSDMMRYIAYFEYEKLVAFDIYHRYIFIDISLWSIMRRKPKFTMRFLYALLSALNVRLGWYEMVPQREMDITLFFITTTIDNKYIPLDSYKNASQRKKTALESLFFHGKPLFQFAYINKHIYDFAVYDPILNEKYKT